MHRADRARGAAGAPDAGGEGRSKRMAESPWPRPKLGFRCGRVAAVLAAAGRPDERGEGAPSRRTVDGHRSGAERCPRGRHRSVKRHRGAMRRERRYEKEQCPGSPSRSSRPVGNWPGGEAPVAGRQWLGTSGWAPVAGHQWANSAAIWRMAPGERRPSSGRPGRRANASRGKSPAKPPRSGAIRRMAAGSLQRHVRENGWMKWACQTANSTNPPRNAISRPFFSLPYPPPSASRANGKPSGVAPFAR